MKFAKPAAIAAILLAGLALAQDREAPKEKKTESKPAADTQSDLKDVKQRGSYALGYQHAKNIQGIGLDVDTESILRGLRDGLSGTKPALSERELQTAIQELQQEFNARRQERAAQLEKESKAFLEENKKKPGVKVLASGLQYKVLKEGNGPSPKSTDTVKANYRGTFVDGKQFDSSYDREPAIFPLRQVIPGWQEALPLMKVGSKWQIYVPAALAYREQGKGTVPPNAALIFDIELLGIEKSEQP